MLLGAGVFALVGGDPDPAVTTSTTRTSSDSGPGPSTTVTAVPPEIPTTIPPEAVIVEPGQEIQDLVDSNPEGTTFYLRAGVHVATGNIHIAPKTGNTFLGEPGATLDGQGIAEYAFLDAAPADDVTIRGLIIENYATPVQRGAIDAAGAGWRVIDSEIRLNAAAGINLRGPRTEIRGNRIYENAQIGLKLQDADGSSVIANEIFRNNPDEAFDPAWEAGGTKFLRTTGLVVAKNEVHDNVGPGLWTDHDNFEVTYRGNIVRDNTGPGIFHEISGSAVIEGNTVIGNAHGFYLGGILVANSSEVTVFDNILMDNDGGIVALQDDREGFPLTRVTVEGNRVRYTEGVTGMILNGGPDVTSMSFRGNQYVTSASRPFHWGRRALSPSDWTGLGQDPDSVFCDLRRDECPDFSAPVSSH